jgi:chemotaxis protein methyltransferase CheR
MTDSKIDFFILPAMSDRVYHKLSSLLTEHLGIKLPPDKRVMLQSRVLKRLKALGLKSYEAYADFIFSPQGLDEELAHLFDVTTTNKTEFFREPAHFEILLSTILPAYARRVEISSGKPLVVWSAGCSTGEEPYTLAMTLAEYRRTHPGFDFLVLASDISIRVLEIARRAVYAEDRIDAIPPALRRRYLSRSRDRRRREIRIVPDLRGKVIFFRLNLMEERFVLPAQPDIIFCRNVIIYFDRETQLELVRRFHRCLQPDGYLFSGHSETFCNMDVPFTQLMPTVYIRRDRE